MKRLLTKTVVHGITAAASMLCFSMAMAPANAGVIKGTYSVTLNSSEPHLVVHHAAVAPNPFTTFSLTEGNSVTFDLFEIWSEEQLNTEDTVPEPASVHFDFLLPGASDGTITGTTYAYSYFLSGIFVREAGASWDAPLVVQYGHLSDGLFSIDLSPAFFNNSFYGGPGRANGGIVRATVTLLQQATLPEPGGLVMFGFGLLMLGVLSRRRRSKR